MKTDRPRFDAATRAALCAAALSLAALAGACVQSAPAGGGTDTRQGAQSMYVQPSPAQTAQPTPAPATPAVESPLPPPEGFVNDFANVIDAETESLLEERLRRLKERAKIEMGVATVETTGGRDIAEYTLAVARGWGLGPPAGQEGGGLLLVLAVKDRVWQLEVTRSLLADLPNEVTAPIGNSMTESLRKRLYGEAVTKCVDGLIKRLAERRGFSMQEDELILQALPEEKPKPSEKPKAGDSRKAAPRATP
jgi:hypothetical protein